MSRRNRKERGGSTVSGHVSSTKNKRQRRNSSMRTIELATSRDFIAQCIMEKYREFGFEDKDFIANVVLEGIPDIVPMKVNFRKELEVEIKKNNG
jgi:hypothetical protein